MHRLPSVYNLEKAETSKVDNLKKFLDSPNGAKFQNVTKIIFLCFVLVRTKYVSIYYEEKERFNLYFA